ncbi:methyl-accepting chemotaxis protein [Chitinivorax tropicus]|uniref:Methyl-accepting chemotaxis protein n=1 Tax=Chitinivorax tropicus TaxID=714531 RepID=A0A840MLE4_9PROT|nr:methyl-accepting chemotaxis protein [Chitinivorax tropicus]MBB5017697.1 methyl-accepting chemotaxis protein [Chitinivorax tropicus]
MRLSKSSINLQVSLSAGILIVAVFIAMAILLGRHVGSRFSVAEEREVSLSRDGMVRLLSAYNNTLKENVVRTAHLFWDSFPGGFTLDSGLVKVADRDVPTIKAGEVMLNNHFAQVDNFAERTGGNATIFVKQGDDFVRVSTSVKKENGERAIGTLLDRQSPAYAKMKAGEAYTGRVTLFGKQFMTHYQPIKDASGQLIGILYIGLDFTQSLDKIKQDLKTQHQNDGGFSFAVDMRPGKPFGHVEFHPTLEGKNVISDDKLAGAAALKSMLDSGQGTSVFNWSDEKGATHTWLVSFSQVPDWGWVVGTARDLDEIHAVGASVRNIVLVGSLLAAVLLSVLLSLMLRKMVTRPLQGVLQDLSMLAQGNFRMPVTMNRQDELGQLQRAIHDVQQATSSAIAEITKASSDVGHAAEQIHLATETVLQGATVQSNAAEAMAATVEQMSVSISRLADGAKDAEFLSRNSGDLSQSGAEVISKATGAMTQIANSVKDASKEVHFMGEQSARISSIVSVINEIADQTNLLALNAAIESARAGEQGRGFSVVADEVRKLAERTAQSTREIAEMIDSVQGATKRAVSIMDQGVAMVEDGVNLASAAGQSISQIRDSSFQVVQRVEEMTAALDEQNAGGQDVARHVQGIAVMASQTSQQTNELESLVTRLKHDAMLLNKATERFNV